jgi:chromosome partitioning protein
MRTWAFVQQKGGSGKSTVATNLSVHAEERGETVLIVDLDPQNSASLWSNARGTNKPTVFNGNPEKLTDIVRSAATLGATLCVIDSPSKLDAIALAAIRAADMIVCPTMPDLFNVGSLQDTVRLLEDAEKLHATVGVVNNVDTSGADARIAHLKGALETFHMLVCPTVIRHHAMFPIAIEKGKGVTECGQKAKKAADEIRALWAFLDKRAKQLAAPTVKAKKETAKS